MDEAKLKELDERLGQEMLRAASEYDAAKRDLAAHHQKMGAELESLVLQAAARKGAVDAVLKGEGLTPERAKACMEYLQLMARIGRARQGSRLAYPGGADAPLGKPLGSA
jgi:hypothetical protein